MSTADACAREAAWLSITTDALPALLAPAGPFEIVQAYWPGAKFAAKKNAIYVQRRRAVVKRFGGRRLMPSHEFALKIVWPVKTAVAGVAEAEAQNLDNAIELLRQRVNGLPGDKSHGGRFLSAAETPPGTYFQVDFDDPELTIPQGGWLRALVTYPADDVELLG
jgi:hypothetical protein